MAEVSEVEALLSREEVQRAAGEASATLVPPPRHYLVAIALLLVVTLYLGPFLSFPLTQLLPPQSWAWTAPALFIAVPTIAFLFGITWVNRWYNRRSASAYRRMWDEREIPKQVNARYRILDTGFEMKTERGTYLIEWTAISDVVHVAGGWVVWSDLNSYFVPASAFADEAAERTFIRALVSRISLPAQRRSVAATRFADAS